MQNIRLSTLLMALVLLCSFSCGPDAKRDNPLDPVNGRGVWGTVRNKIASAVPGAVVTARPVNINTTCNALGAYSLDLPGGEKYIITVSHPQYRDASDTVDVPSDGKLEHDFIIAGKPSLSLPKVNTYKIAHEIGTIDFGLKLECLGTHPEDSTYLNDYNVYAVVNNTNYPASITAGGPLSKKYHWDLDLSIIFGPIADPDTLIVGKTLSFVIDPGEGVSSIQAMVPQFMDVPTNLTPNSGAVITLPSYLSWNNAVPNPDITVEIWQGNYLYWSISTANVSSVSGPNTLNPGIYTWLVRTTDTTGNSATTEATFTIP